MIECQTAAFDAAECLVRIKCEEKRLSVIVFFMSKRQSCSDLGYIVRDLLLAFDISREAYRSEV